MLLGLNDSLVCLLISFFFISGMNAWVLDLWCLITLRSLVEKEEGQMRRCIRCVFDHSTYRTRHKMHLKPLFFLIFYLNVPFSLLRNEISWFKHKHNSIKMTMLKSVRASDRSLSIEWNNRKKWINFFFFVQFLVFIAKDKTVKKIYYWPIHFWLAVHI